MMKFWTNIRKLHHHLYFFIIVVKYWSEPWTKIIHIALEVLCKTGNTFMQSTSQELWTHNKIELNYFYIRQLCLVTLYQALA